MTEQEFATRLVLGTAQFGLAYGVNNVAGQPSLATVADILREAQLAGIHMLDTAAAYGNSENRLGELKAITEGFDIVTKLTDGSAESVSHQLQESKARLKRDQIYGVMFHSAQKFVSTEEGWQTLWRATQNADIQKVGLSVYRMPHILTGDFAQVAYLPTSPDLLQIPFSVLDQHFGAHLSYLSNEGKREIHARSAFLQGLLLRAPDKLPPFFKPLESKLLVLRQIAADIQVPLAALLLLFVAQTPGISRVVIGVDSVANLHENLSAAAYWESALAVRPQLLELAELDDTYTLPYTWPKTT